MSGPGLIAADLFFPAKDDWDTSPCLTICDCWSRFCRVFVVENKTKKMMIPLFEKFFKELMSLGHKPKIFISDKGSEFIGLKTTALFKKWKITVFHSPTGTPIHLVEGLQAQIMRKAEIFRTAKITEDPGHLMYLISEQLNNQPRRQFDNKTPYQLLTLNRTMRKDANAFSNVHKANPDVVNLEGLPHILVGNKCRFLTWTRKQQVEGKVKGYSEKWSRSIHTVCKMVRIKKNRDVYKFYISDMCHYFWRHELLKIGSVIDTVVPKNLFKLVDKTVYATVDGIKPKAKKKPKRKKLEKVEGKLDVAESNIITRPRRKERVKYGKYF